MALRDVDLDRFFHPRRVLVLGASDTPGRPNTAMLTKIRRWAEHHGAEVLPVNPNRAEVAGMRCFASVDDVDGPIDLAVILVGAAVDAFEQLLTRDVAFAVIFAAGFAELGEQGAALQRRLETLVASGSTHLLGPNTNLNAFELYPDEFPSPAVALITQSGHQGRPVFQAQELGFSMSHWAPTGNEADLEFADFAAWFADQPEVGVIAAYIEGFKDGRTFALAADHAATRGVPLVIVKVGRTEEGRSMARSHTGHLTGSDAVISAAFRQYGVTRVDGLDELVDTAAMLARSKPPKGDGVCVYSISGGTGAHMADLASAAGLRLPELTKATQAQLHEWIPTYLRVSNPVDNGGPPSSDWRGRKIIDAILADANVDLVICPITGALASMGKPLATDLVAAAQTTDKPVCVIWGSPTTDDAYEVLVESQVPLFRTFSNCVGAVKAYFGYHAFAQRYRSPFAKPVLRRSPAAAIVEPVLAQAGAYGTLSEHDAKTVLASYGITSAREELCGSARDAVRAAAAIGSPVVMKACGPELAHKTELGLVRLGVATAAEVRKVYAQLAEHGSQGVLVCETVSRGVETVLGLATDDLFGPTIMFGLGGVALELFRDVTFRVPPFGREEAARMVAETRASALLRGFRGSPPSDTKALVDAVMALQRLALDHAGRISEVDVNPLVVRPRGQGVVALDALITLAPV